MQVWKPTSDTNDDATRNGLVSLNQELQRSNANIETFIKTQSSGKLLDPVPFLSIR